MNVLKLIKTPIQNLVKTNLTIKLRNDIGYKKIDECLNEIKEIERIQFQNNKVKNWYEEIDAIKIRKPWLYKNFK